MDIGELMLSLKLDRSTFDRQMNALQMENFKGITASIGFNPTSTISTVRKSLEGVQAHLDRNPLQVRVNHKPLEELNQHLDLKKKHLKEVVEYFNNNPIKPRLDKSAFNSMAVKIAVSHSVVVDQQKESTASSKVNAATQTTNSELKSIRSVLEDIREVVSIGKDVIGLIKGTNESLRENKKVGKQTADNTAFSPIRSFLESSVDNLSKSNLFKKTKEHLLDSVDSLNFIDSILSQSIEKNRNTIKEFHHTLISEILASFKISMQGVDVDDFLSPIIDSLLGEGATKKASIYTNRESNLRTAKQSEARKKEQKLIYDNMGDINRRDLEKAQIKKSEAVEKYKNILLESSVQETKYLLEIIDRSFPYIKKTKQGEKLFASSTQLLRMYNGASEEKKRDLLPYFERSANLLDRQYSEQYKIFQDELRNLRDKESKLLIPKKNKEGKDVPLLPSKQKKKANLEKTINALAGILARSKDPVNALEEERAYKANQLSLLLTDYEKYLLLVKQIKNQRSRVETVTGIPYNIIKAGENLGISVENLPNIKQVENLGNARAAFTGALNQIEIAKDSPIDYEAAYHELVHFLQASSPVRGIENIPTTAPLPEINAEDKEYVNKQLKGYKAKEIPVEREAYVRGIAAKREEDRRAILNKNRISLGNTFGSTGESINTNIVEFLKQISSSKADIIGMGLGKGQLARTAIDLKQKEKQIRTRLIELQNEYKNVYQDLSFEESEKLVEEVNKNLKLLNQLFKINKLIQAKANLEFNNAGVPIEAVFATGKELLQRREDARERLARKRANRELFSNSTTTRSIPVKDDWFTTDPWSLESEQKKTQSTAKPEKVDLKTIASILKNIDNTLRSGNSLSDRIATGVASATSSIDSLGSILLGGSPASPFASPFASPWNPPFAESSSALAIFNQPTGELSRFGTVIDEASISVKGSLAYWNAAIEDERSSLVRSLHYWTAAINDEFNISGVFEGINKIANNDAVRFLALTGVTKLGQASLTAARSTYTLARVAEDIALTAIPFGHAIKKGTQFALPYAAFGAGTMALGGAGGLLEAGSMAHGLLAPAIEGAGSLVTGAASGLGMHGMNAFLLEKGISMATGGAELATYALPAVTGGQMVKKVAEQTIGKVEKALTSDRPLPQLLPAATMERIDGTKKALKAVTNLLLEAKSLEKINPQQALLLSAQASSTLKALAPAIDKEIAATPVENRTNNPFSQLKATVAKQAKAIENIQKNAAKITGAIANVSKNIAFDLTPPSGLTTDKQVYVELKNRIQAKNREIKSAYDRGDLGAGQLNDELITQTKLLLEELSKTKLSKEHERSIKGVRGDLTRTAKQVISAAESRKIKNTAVDIGIDLQPAGKDIVEGLARGIDLSIPLAEKAVVDLARDMNQSFKSIEQIESPSKIWHKYGTEITLGLILGLASYNGRLKSSSEKVAFLLNESFKKIEGINSPSRVWMQYGRDLIDGLMQGVRNSNASGRQLAQNFNNTFIAPSSDKIKQLKRELQDLYQQKGTIGVISHPVIKDLLVNSAGLAGSAYGADFGDMASLGGDLIGALLARNITNAGISATNALSQIQNTDLFDTLKQLLTHIAEEHKQIGTELKGDILGWAVGNGSANAIDLAATSLDTILPGAGSIASIPLKGSLIAGATVPPLLKAMERNGAAMGQGLTNGINSQTRNATTAATNLANNTNRAFQQVQQIQSPSKKWKGYGSDIVKGFVSGLGNSRSIGEQYAANFNAGFNKKNFKLDPLTIDVKAIRVYDELIGQQQLLLPEYSDNSMTPEKVRERAERRAAERERIRRDLGIKLKPQLLLPEYSDNSMTPEKVRERIERRAAERERIRRDLGINLKPQPALSDIDKELKRLKEQLKDKPQLGLIEQLNYLLAKLALVKERFKEAIPYKLENIQDKAKQFTANFSENKEYLTGKILTFKLDAEPIKNKINEVGSSIANSNIGKNISYLWSKIQTARLKISEEIDYIIAKGKTLAKEQFEAIRYGKPSNKSRILPDPSTEPDLTDSVIRTEQALKAYEVEVQKLESQVRAKTEGRKLGGKILDILKDVVIVGFGIKAIRGLIQGTFGILGEIIQNQLLDLRTLINKGIEFQQLKIKLSFITPDGQSPKDYLEKLKTKANSSGVDLTQYANNIVAFDRATLNTPIAGQSQNIYERFSKGLSGMPRESQQNALLAVTQIAAKGKVSLEELNGQLSEAMPGALSSAAKAMGVTNGELIKMVANGDVLSEDLLPKLAQQLEIESLPKLASSIDSGAFALNELNNEFTLFQGQLGEVALTASKPFMGGLSGTLKTLNEDIGSLINVAIAATSVMTVYFAQSFLRLSGLVDKATGSFVGFTKAGELLKTAMVGLFKQLLIIGTVFAVIKGVEVFTSVKNGTEDVNRNLKTVRESLRLTQQEYAKTSKAANQYLGENRFAGVEKIEEVLKTQRPSSPQSDKGAIADWFFDQYKGFERTNLKPTDQITFGEQQQLEETNKTSDFLDRTTAQIQTTFGTIIGNPQNIDKSIKDIQSLNEQIATLQAEKKVLRIINPEDGNAAVELDKRIQSLRDNLYNMQSSLMPGGQATAELIIAQLNERKTKLMQQRDEQGFLSPAIATQITEIDNQIALVNRGLEKWRDIAAQIGLNFKNLGLINAQLQRDLANGLARSTRESIETKISNYDNLFGAKLNTANQSADIDRLQNDLKIQSEIKSRYDRSLSDDIDSSKRQPIEKLLGKRLEDATSADLEYARSQFGDDYDTVLKLLEARAKLNGEIRDTRLSIAQSLNEFRNTLGENRARLLNLNTDRVSSSFVTDRRQIDLQQQAGVGGQLATTYFERLKRSTNQQEAKLIKDRIGAGSPFVTQDIKENTGIVTDDVRLLNAEQIDFLSKVDQLKPETKAVITNLQKVVSLNQENEQLSLTIARQTYKGLDTLARQLAALQLKTSIASFTNQINNLNSPVLNQEVFSGRQGLRSSTRDNAQELVSQRQAFKDFIRSIQDLIFTLNNQIAQTQEELVKSFRSIEVDRIGGDMAAITALGFNGIVSQIGGKIQELFSEASQLLSSDTRPQLKRDLASTQREYEKQLIDFDRQSLSLNTNVGNSIFQRQQSNRESDRSRQELNQRNEMSYDELKQTALGLRQQQIEYNRAAAEAENLAAQNNLKIAIPRSTSVIPTDFEIDSAASESWGKMQSIYDEQIALNESFIYSMQRIQSEGNSQIASERATYEQLHREFVALKEEQIAAEGERIAVATDNLGKKIQAVVTGFTATLTDALIAANRQLEDFKFGNIDFLNQFRPMPFNEKYSDVDRTVGKRFADQRRSQEDYSRQLDRFITESAGETSIDSLVNKIAGSDAIAPELRDKFISEIRGAKTLEELNAVVDRYKEIKKEIDRMLKVDLSPEQEQRAKNYERFKLERQFNLNYAQSSSSLNNDLYSEYLTENKNIVNPFDRTDIEQKGKEQQWNADYLGRQEGYYQQYESGQIDLPTLTIFLTELERLNQFKLENIRQEFDLLGRTIEDTFSDSFQKGLNEFILGKSTILEFLDSIVRAFAEAFSTIASQWVQSQITNLLFGGTSTELNNPIAATPQSSPFGGIGGLLGGVIGLFNDGGRADSPVEIQNFNNGGAASLGLGVLKAMQREGANALPVVVSKGEQILSTNNGDAQFFRTLQASGQWLRLKQNNYQVNNYKYGGMAGGTGDINGGNNSKQSLKDRAREGNNITINVKTPDADSFRKAQGQIRRDTSFELRRDEKRNG